MQGASVTHTVSLDHMLPFDPDDALTLSTHAATKAPGIVGEEEEFEWDTAPTYRPLKETAIDMVPPVGNVDPPRKKILSQANKQSMYLSGCLLAAVRNQDEDEVAKWLRAGQSEGVAIAMDIKTGKTTLHYAAECGNLQICKMLVDADADATTLDKYGKTPVHLAVLFYSIPSAAGEKSYEWHVPSKLTLVQTAARYDKPKILESLLRLGYLPSERTGCGETALHLAARYGFLEVAKVLVAAGAEIHAATHPHGQTPLHYACIHGQTSVATFLVHRGADAHLPDSTPARKTPADKCEDLGHRATLNALLAASVEYRDVLTMLDNTARTKHGRNVEAIVAFERERVALRQVLRRQGRAEQVLLGKHKKLEEGVLFVAEARRKARLRALGLDPKSLPASRRSSPGSRGPSRAATLGGAAILVGDSLSEAVAAAMEEDARELEARGIVHRNSVGVLWEDGAAKEQNGQGQGEDHARLKERTHTPPSAHTVTGLFKRPSLPKGSRESSRVNSRTWSRHSTPEEQEGFGSLSPLPQLGGPSSTGPRSGALARTRSGRLDLDNSAPLRHTAARRTAPYEPGIRSNPRD